MKGLLFTYGLCYGGAVVSLFNPFAGLLIYICFAIVKPEAMWYWSVPQGNYSRVVALALLAGWTFRGFGNWRFGAARCIVVSLVGFQLWMVVAAALAPNQELAWRYTEGIFKIVLPFLVGITLIDSAGKLKALAWVMVLSQGYLALEFNQTYLGGYNRLWEEGFGSLDNNGEAVALSMFFGTALFLGMHEDRWWKKLLAIAFAGLMTHAVLFSFSRGGMLATCCSGLTAFLIMPKRPIHFVALALVVVIGLRLAGKEVQARFLTTFASQEQRDSSAESRLDLWKACVDLTWKHPITGVGPDHFPLHAPEYGFVLGKQAHTTWLRIPAEMGIPGLLCFLGFHGLCLKRLWKFTRDQVPVHDPWLRYLSRGVIASLVGFALSAQFVSVERLEGPYYVALIGAGVIKVASLRQQDAGSWDAPQNESLPEPVGEEGYAAELAGAETWPVNGAVDG